MSKSKFSALAACLCVGLGATAGTPADAAPAKKKPAARKPAARKSAAKPAAKPAAPAGAQLARVEIVPPKFTLSGKGSAQRYLVLGYYANGSMKDLTPSAKVTKTGTGGVRIENGKIVAVSNGAATVSAAVGGKTTTMSVTVQNASDPSEWSFANEIVPVLTKAGCNSGGCHGSPSGRGGFRLSLYGYEPDYDYDQIVKEKKGARLNLNSPTGSSLLQKPTMKVPHGGGMRFKEGSDYYNRMLAWVKAGAPKQPEFDPRLARIEIFPNEWTIDQPDQEQQVIVIAHRDDGTSQDVTQYARYNTNDDAVAEVDDDGIITSTGKGETIIMVRYLGGVGVVSLKVPRDPVPASTYDNFKPVNYIDDAVLEKLREVRVPPSGPASDSEFIRRAYIDTCGLIPTPEEVRAFLDSKDPNKRAKLVDSLLNRPEFVQYWALKWSDLLSNDSDVKKGKGNQVFYRWIKDSIAKNKPYDQFARELITATGSAYRYGPANWYNIRDYDALQLGSNTSQVFLGIRMDCARCHNHPFEAWSQMDYYGLAAFFGKTKFKRGVDEDERIFYAAVDGDVKHPRTSAVVEPKFPAGDFPTFGPDEDRREKLAQWITSPSNPWFKRSIANRLWNNFLGRGIVQPVDDFRLTNPASNQKLLDAMAEKVVAYKFDLKGVMRDILNSRTYQTTSVHNQWNVNDRFYNSRAWPRRMYAEVLLDAICSATGVRDFFGPYERAVAVPDNRLNNGFLDLFGRAKRDLTCECERTEDSNVTMVLNLINGPTVNQKLGSPNGRVMQLLNAKKTPDQITEELYLAALARKPTEKEMAAALKLFSKAPNPKEGAEDLMWGLLNMKEFLLNH